MKKFRYIVSIALSLSILWCFSFAMAQEVMEGIDVSVYQGDIDFSQVRSAGVETVYIRAAEGQDRVDPYFEQNYAKARAAGLKVGFYHYITPMDTGQAKSQAEFFYSLIRDKEMDCYPAMDYEAFGGLLSAQINEIALTYLQTLETLLGDTPAIYSDASNAASLWGEELAKYPLWIAHYGVESPGNTGVWSDWAGFQYTDTGRVDGITGDVDRNLFRPLILIGNWQPDDEGGGENGGEQNGTETVYIIQSGDTLWSIARRFGTTVDAIADLNGIANPDLIYAGETIRIPGSTVPAGNVYVVRRGDTLWSIARRFGTTVDAIADLNGIANPDLIYAGETIRIPGSAVPAGNVYVVRRGDTLWNIARRFGTTVEDIAQLNGITDPDLIYAGETLRIPGAAPSERVYVVRKGDTLSEIAQRFGTTAGALAARNGIANADLIYPGQRLYV